jgi:predicted nucleic acid-binding protein
MKDRVLVDTSIWIAYFQENAPAEIAELVDDILSQCEVYVPKIVIAELVQGAHAERDLSVILGFFGAFTIVGEREDTWVKAGRLSYTLKKKGRTINLADCYIAIQARENECSVLTLDNHFNEMEKEVGFRLISI